MQKVLFLDRDGTLVIEPPEDYQLDSLDKLEFYPGVFKWLGKIVEELDYELVMVTNQDGLGTDSFPEKDFWPAQEKIIKAFKNEGIEFTDIFIDKTLPAENASSRKPGTAMLTKYVYGSYDLENSVVVGDRPSDIQLAQNLGSQSIFLTHSKNNEANLSTSCWKDVYQYLKSNHRKATITRQTSETKIDISVDLNGTGISIIDTGLPFFDHMLDQLARHGGIDLVIKVIGDLEIDEHHTIEDTAIVLGECFRKALGSKKGIQRYGFLLPMDDCLAQVALDFGGRPWLVWDATFKREKIGDMPTEMFKHFFKSFSDTAQCNLNIKAEGGNEHHKIESIFKAFANSIKMAIQETGKFNIPSTKGKL
jgi:imidazoleglycerol-phosphate dehydratase/histidinol-phosphatase